MANKKLLRAEKNRDAWIELYAAAVRSYIDHLQRGNYYQANAVAAIIEDTRKQVEQACIEFEEAH